MNQLDIFTERPHVQRGSSIVARERDGRALRDNGIERAISHAGREWADRAFDYFKQYAKAVGPRNEFKTEEVRAWAESLGFLAPPDPRAWGAIAKRMCKAELMRKVGTGPAKAARVHCGLVSIWQAT